MGREVRRVHKSWVHPKDNDGVFIPLFDGIAFKPRLERWKLGRSKWTNGLREDFNGSWQPLSDSERSMSYEEWDGPVPNEKDYMPQWQEEERTHLMMYENTTEGTPISPAFTTVDELAKWLADNNASAFGSATATYEEWLSMCEVGSCPTAIVSNKGVQSGVASTKDLN